VKRTQEEIRIRQAGSADQGALRDFLTGLSVRTRYLRFFTGALPTSPAMLRVLAGDRPGTDALVATRNGAVIGHAVATHTAGPGGAATAEMGVVVADAWQGRGIGSGLVRALAARAAARGATTLVMDVLVENQQVLAMIASRWPAARHDRSAAQVTVHARLAPGRTDAAERPAGDSPGPASRAVPAALAS
jgi:GNAT superfamily N-acetyltransferase